MPVTGEERSTSAEFECFDVDIHDAVAHVVLKRPAQFNAMVRGFWTELPAIVDDISGNARARCIVLSSTGKHFSAGMDLGALGVDATAVPDRQIAAEKLRFQIRALQRAFDALADARMPVLVAIQGGCIGGAVDMVTACDIRYATRDAFFCIQEINIGMTADVGTFPRLCRLIPDGALRELAYTGRRLPAEQALRLGLVNEVFDTQEQMLAHVRAIALEIAAKAPLAVTGSKAMIDYARDHGTRDALDQVALWNAAMYAPAQMAEAIDARRQDRTALFPDLLPIG